ncbi:hypothetical protein CLV78_101536 [Aliiruegeria haliotis]|uniref:Uncharacterized protein n=1 Tax=Aliiruegeria haliotis TaxID=1280846 RepID=A0A2T0RZ37_9RHOB|nr:hypothetical protein [Aliiruegeria haliotis]PRY26441.1 hypothetical protein CLV78_101536 [Aliiruegeria haliotis]
MTSDKLFLHAADSLVGFYTQEFGGKDHGRYRISAKLLRALMRRRRLYEADISRLARELLERGYVLVDMEGFFVVLSANSFVNYRRVSDTIVQDAVEGFQRNGGLAPGGT